MGLWIAWPLPWQRPPARQRRLRHNPRMQVHQRARLPDPRRWPKPWRSVLFTVCAATAFGIALLVVSYMLDLQLRSEPDLPGGFEGLEGWMALLIAVPAALLLAMVARYTAPSPRHQRVLPALWGLLILAAFLSGLDAFDLELVR